MALPLCPVCQNSYDTRRQPRSLQPCGHGICDLCFDQYVSRGGETCPMCRVDIVGSAINYDLRSMCKPPETGWKQDLLRLLGRHLPGKEVEVSDRFKNVAPLIRLRCEWCLGSLKEARAVLVSMVLKMPVPEVLHWITVLNFDSDIEARLLEHVSTLLDHTAFLKEDTWLLELSHTV